MIKSTYQIVKPTLLRKIKISLLDNERNCTASKTVYFFSVCGSYTKSEKKKIDHGYLVGLAFIFSQDYEQGTKSLKYLHKGWSYKWELKEPAFLTLTGTKGISDPLLLQFFL